MIERRRLGPLLRWAVSLGVLGVLFCWLDSRAIAAQMSRIAPGWLAAALAVTVVQTLLSAWRWRFTARRLGLDLTRSRALVDYYLAVFVNQVLPGGVLGDALRAHRHARRSRSAGAAWRAVIIERASGQVVVAAGTIGVLLSLPAWRDVLAGSWPGKAGAGVFAGLAGILLIALPLAAARRWPQHWQALRADTHRALLARVAWPRQLAASMAIVFTYALVFALAGHGIGAEIGFGRLLAVALPILLAMLVPFSVAGWGFREAAAASVWLALGFPAEEGVAVAMTYGAINLAASLPGALVLVRHPVQSWVAR
ncbi:MAG: lysylphosphatidylglycerol synthase transmembrane domain-containing protein [Wenzhouxiangella sp.]|jgi:uncharacterized membrane protein YbhN (UPF0104 family)|nr:lysylphosphatidylglycerol synthase transmembrane domain-containing protein [Wenzhouxiangella sp.]